MMQEHMTTQDADFEAFASYVTKSLMSMRNEMNVNHVATISRINHMIAFENDNHHHYIRFYRERYEFLDYHYGNDGQGWYKGMRLVPRGQGRR